MSTIGKLKYAPIKYKPLSKMGEEIIHKTGLKYWNIPESEIFVMFNTKKSKNRCFMATYPRKINRDGEKNIPSLYVAKIFSIPLRCGFGTKMLDFAKAHSKKIGCNGYFHLDAHSAYTPHSIPHIFYKKVGLNTQYAYVNDRLDKFIKSGKNATYKNFNNMRMYYPPIKNPESRWQTILKLFTKSKI